MNNRTYRLHDTSINVASRTNEVEPHLGWTKPDYKTLSAVIRALKAKGFTFTTDPRIDNEHYRTLNKYHRMGRRQTPSGDLFVATEAHPAGLTFEFFQNVVMVNRNGGRYDFDKRDKMPYLIGKAYEVALRAALDALDDAGFSFQAARHRLDPKGYFEGRYSDGPDGWPSTEQLGGKSWRITDAGGRLIQSGETRLFRDFDGRVRRGRCYGGINGMWLVTFGPGRGDLRQLSSYKLFEGDPSAMPRRAIPRLTAISRLRRLLDDAVRAQEFERAIRFRDALRRIEPEQEASCAA